VTGPTAIREDRAAVLGVALIVLGWLLPAFASWIALGPYPRAALLAAPPLAVAGVAVLGRTHLRAALPLAGAAVAAHLLTYDPFFDPACDRTCLSAPAPLSTVVGTRPATLIVFGLTLAAAVAAGSARQSWPLWLAGAGTATLTVLAVGAPLVDRAGTADALLTAAAVLAPGAVGAAALRVRYVRRRVLRAVAQLSGSVPAGALRGPVVAVHFAVAETGSAAADLTWLDGAGRPVPDEDRAAAVLHDGATPAVRLVLGRRGDRDLALAAITPATRLALENARLRATATFQLTELQASQRRIVEAADGERRRIERDLHDGAQQRLVAVTMLLRSAAAGSDAALGAITEADGHVRQALAALRAQSAESFAAVLATEGLEAAVEDLVARFPVPVESTVTLSGAALGWPAQRAALAAVAEVLDNVARHAPASRARIGIADSDGWLTVQGTDDGPGGATIGDGLTAVADRAGALGGRLRLRSPLGAGTTVVVTLPCA
jgi:signal transduction histidine kinase